MKLSALILCGCVLTVGCSKPQSGQAQAPKIAKSVAVSPWTITSHKDEMTDAIVATMTTPEETGNGDFSVVCGPEGKVFEFTSSLFLGTKSYAHIQYRLDDGNPADARAAINDKEAMLFWVNDIKKAIKTGGDPFMVAINGWEMSVELTTKPHKRLRVRLNSFDGGQANLSFNAAGFREKLVELNKACGVK